MRGASSAATLTGRNVRAASALNSVAPGATAAYSSSENGRSCGGLGSRKLTIASRSGSSNGSGSSSSSLMTVRAVVFVPVPTARQNTAASVQPGRASNPRQA